VRRLLERRPYEFSVSVTTRAPRPGEREGVHYRFVDRDTFLRMRDAGDLLEWAEYGANLYGTPREPVERARQAGRNVLLEIEIQGAVQVRDADPEAVLVFVAPPDVDELERRLRGRGDTDEAAMERRLRIARDELAGASSLFDHIVVNDRVERAVDEILDFLDFRGSRERPVAD
jgi:guanylate kinase